MGKKRSAAEAADPPVAPVAGDIDGPGDLPAAKRLQQRRSLFIRSLPTTATTESLIEHFSESFPIKHAVAVVDKATGQCRGYGFVTFADAEDAQRAKEEFNGSTLGGRKIVLDIAEPRHRDQDGPAPAAERSAVVAKPVKGRRASENDQTEGQLPPKLIIRNLPWTIKTGEQLGSLFRAYGKIKQAYLPSKKPGLLSGFGFVVLRGRKNAEKAIEGVNGKELDGRTLAVDWAVKKADWEKQASNGDVKGDDQLKPILDDDDDDDEEEEIDEDGDGDDDTESMETDEGEDEEVNGALQELDSDVDEEVDEEAERARTRPVQNFSSTLFVRNLSYACTDDDLKDKFSQFGAVRYARIVLDPETERPRGTGFVCFFDEDAAMACLRDAPRSTLEPTIQGKKSKPAASRSILQSEAADPTGNYTIDGRVLQVTRAVDRTEASRLTELGIAQRGDRDKDKRKLYLLNEGTIAAGSALYDALSSSERTMRENSLKQRKQLIQSNPSLHLSLTRLSIRNIPRSIDSKELKALAREAVVGFAKDAKEGKRQPLSKEERMRGGEEMTEAERKRKLKGTGVVKQAKVVFEGREGAKVDEKSGGGRSRGYGFIEYHTHRAALMGLRWLNGHAVGSAAGTAPAGKKSKSKAEDAEDAKERKKRLIVEFAIENAQVVARRSDREKKARDTPRKSKKAITADDSTEAKEAEAEVDEQEQDKAKRRQQIINKKRAMRRNKRKAGKGS